MRTVSSYLFLLLFVTVTSCSGPDARGIADKRSDFRSFLPMKSNPAQDGLKSVKPFFHRANQAEILRAINGACAGGRSGSSVYNEAKHTGYYVNCNPRNRQLLNGYLPLNPSVQPHSR
jgi:hypothetical protein